MDRPRDNKQALINVFTVTGLGIEYDNHEFAGTGRCQMSTGWHGDYLNDCIRYRVSRNVVD